MKILVVDDSVVYRSAIKSALRSSHETFEIDVASNGKIAVEKIKMKSFDIMTLDLEMPIMDGIETIKAVREFNKEIIIIIFSSQNINSAKKTFYALELGANDFVRKVDGGSDIEANIGMIQQELLPRFKAFTGKKHLPKSKPQHGIDDHSWKEFKPDIICIASSTGGPDALKKLFSKMKKLSVPVVLVQHMPPVFTTQLASGLDQVHEGNVVEAKGGETLQPGVTYLAPGDYHMCIKKKGMEYNIELNQKEKVCYVRPAADVLFESVASSFDGRILSIVLTGMGADGAKGSKALKNKGAKVIIQDEKSCVVWGMPKAVFDLQGLHYAEHNGEMIELVKLGNVLNFEEKQPQNILNIVILRVGGKKLGILVDKIFEFEEVVMRKISSQIESGDLYLGASLVGAGEVALILSAEGLARKVGVEITSQEKDFDNEEENPHLSLVKEYMLFSTSGGENLCIDLAWVERFEKIDCHKIEEVGDRYLYRYFNQNLILVDPANLIGLTEKDLFVRAKSQERSTFDVIVTNFDNKLMGLVVHKLEEVKSTTDSLNTDTIDTEGLAGSLYLDKKTICVLGLEVLAHKVFQKKSLRSEHVLEVKKAA